MKKLLAIFLALLTAVAMTSPAAADDPTPTPTPQPPAEKMDVTVLLAAHQQSTHPISGSVQCTTIEGGFYEVSTLGAVSFETADFTCLGEVTWSIAYYYGGAHWSAGGIDVIVSNTDPYYYDADFQTTHDLWGSGTNGVGEVASGQVTHGGWGHTGLEENVVSYIYVHDSTRAPCSEQWDDVSEVASGAIDATLENGVGATLVVTNEYKLSVWGGPWNDSIADRYDTALKIGTDDWQSLADFVEDKESSADCTEGDPLDPNKVTVYFEATDVDWRIRVNDIAAQFADNTGAMQYSLDLVQGASPTGCENQFLQGAALQSGSINAQLEAGVYNHAPPAAGPDPWLAGNWIQIVTSGGPWNDGADPARYDIAIKNPDNTWSELSSDTYSACHTENGNYITVWYQLPTSSGVYLRVNDSAGQFANNSGSMGYAIYTASYSPAPPAGCAELYQLGALVKTVTAPANYQGGVQVGDLYTAKEVGVQEYYAIETSGVWYDNNVPEVWGGLAASADQPEAGDWYDTWMFPTAACAVMLDPIGHWRVYIPVDNNANDYWVRTQEHLDSTWTNNSGSLQFKIYKATYFRVPDYEPGPMPDPGVCDGYYTPGTPDPASHISATDENGVALPALTSGKIYAVETSAGPWHEGDDDVDSYEVAISTDGGSTWENLVDFASAACAQSDDGDHIRVYFQALAGRHYRLRVYDPYDSFSAESGNSGSIDYKLYQNVVVVHSGSCADNYNLHQVTVSNPMIPGLAIDGVKLPDVGIGDNQVYAIEIASSDYWYALLSPGEHRFDAQISTDNGSTWSVFGPAWSQALCVVQAKEAADGAQEWEQVYRIYFTGPSGVTKMRINSNDEVFGGGGALKYILYKAEEKEVPCKECNNPIPPGWQSECYENYLRPTYLFKNVNFQLPSISFGALGTVTFPVFGVPLPAVDDWIAYLQWTVRSYFAWCPEHTAALAAIPTSFDSLEPFGTLAEVNSAIDLLNERLDQFQASGGEGAGYAPYSVIFNSGGGESGGADWQGLLPVVSADSPWAWSGSGPLETHIGEDVTWDPNTAAPSGGQAEEMQYCTDIFIHRFGDAASVGICTMVVLVKQLPKVWNIIQLALDVGAVIILYFYLRNNWIDLRMAA